MLPCKYLGEVKNRKKFFIGLCIFLPNLMNISNFIIVIVVM